MSIYYDLYYNENQNRGQCNSQNICPIHQSIHSILIIYRHRFSRKNTKRKKKPRNNTIIMIESHVLELSFIILIMVSISSLVGFFLQGKIFVLLNEGLWKYWHLLIWNFCVIAHLHYLFYFLMRYKL